jgi:hypothetical protein
MQTLPSLAPVIPLQDFRESRQAGLPDEARAADRGFARAVWDAAWAACLEYVRANPAVITG